MKKKTKVLLLIGDVVLIAALILGVIYYQKRARDAELSAEEDASRRYEAVLTNGEEEVPLNTGLTSFLLIGTDNFADDAKQNKVEAYYNRNLADFLVLLVFDNVKKTVTPLQICRDTMCDVPWLSVNGLVGGTEFQQITYAHTYGTGKEDSCENTRNAVRSLLYDAPVDGYVAFTMDAVGVLNDLVGGVTVTLEEDLPALGDKYVSGATITLRGSDALRFVRYRDTEELDSNIGRMGRHRQYLAAFLDAARISATADEELALRGFRLVEPFLCTDQTAEELTTITDRMLNYKLCPVVAPDGQYVMGEQFAEYYVDESSLWECVRTVFGKNR